jgi:hypothetical protein
MLFPLILFELMLVLRESRLGIDEVPQVDVAPPNSPPRQAPPIPDGPLVPHDAPDHETWNVSPSDLNLIADDWRMGSPGMYFIVPAILSC